MSASDHLQPKQFGEGAEMHKYLPWLINSAHSEVTPRQPNLQILAPRVEATLPGIKMAFLENEQRTIRFRTHLGYNPGVN